MSAAHVEQRGHDLWVRVPGVRLGYLKNVMRANCFPELHALFCKAHDPCKEFTESYAALTKLKPWHKQPRTVIHVGDGAHCRTSAMFAFMTQHTNIAIDPAVRPDFVDEWAELHGVRRFSYQKSRIEDAPDHFGAGRLLFTFVHAHVDTDEVLSRYRGMWDAAYISACCEPGRQLSTKYSVAEEGEDWSVLSPERRYQVVTP